LADSDPLVCHRVANTEPRSYDNPTAFVNTNVLGYDTVDAMARVAYALEERVVRKKLNSDHGDFINVRGVVDILDAILDRNPSRESVADDVACKK
jgi:hypothetical protein